jgi:hypothetical protein
MSTTDSLTNSTHYFKTHTQKITPFITHFIIIISLSYFPMCAFASNPQKPIVNILTWWGYLDQPELIKRIEKKCDAQISVDQYFSNSEFLRRYHDQKSSYDIIIFASTVFENIRNEIPNLPKSLLWKQSNHYNRYIKIHYLKANYPANVVYFAHSISGFLFNPNTITLSGNESLQTIFNKANGKKIVLMDDSAEINKLLNMANDNHAGNLSNNYLENDKINNIIGNKSELYIGNGFKEIYKDPDFAFAYIWSGDAINRIHDASNLIYFIHPTLSYLSSDLLSQNNDRNATYCVSKYLSSKEALHEIENNNYYFTPYANANNIQDHTYKKLYDSFVKILPSLTWAESLPPDDFYNVNKSWDLSKLRLNARKEKLSIE